MSQEEQDSSLNSATEKSEVEKLRDDFTEQFSALKSSFDASTKEKDAKIEELMKHNEELQRALIRNATLGTPQEQPKEKTEEELYQERIASLAKKTIDYMEYRL